jgi:phosphate starvation-inducible PhoH-like protein
MSKKQRPHVVRDLSPQVPQRDKIIQTLSIRERQDFTENQKKIIDLVLNKHSRIVYISGPAGTSKTYLGVYCALKLLNEKRVGEAIYVRTIIESASKSLGSLPGEADLKFGPFTIPLQDKLDELLPRNEASLLIKDERFIGMPINYLRGSSKNATYILADEIQNFSYSEIVTLITRLGKYSKLVACGDTMQSDINGKSGFRRIFSIFDNEESRRNGIYCITLTKDDVVRDGIVKYILEVLEKNLIKIP